MKSHDLSIFRTFICASFLICSGCNLFESVEPAPTAATDTEMLDQDMSGTDAAPVEDMGSSQVDMSGDLGQDMPDSEVFWEAVTAGDEHSCGLRSDGEVYCWGRGLYGRTGLGSEADAARPEPVFTEARFVAIDAGGEHTCALDTDGALWCWGRGSYIGLPNTENAVIPTLVDEGPYIDVSAGNTHSCVVAQNMEVFCTGTNSAGELGLANADESPVLVQVPNVAASQVAAGGDFTCTLDAEGLASCWGRSLADRYEDSERDFSHVPQTYDGLAFVALSAGEQSVCGLTDDRRIFCWGASVYNEDDRSNPETPEAIEAGFDFVDVSTGDDFACGVTSAGVSLCWGNNYRARMGVGGHESSPSVVRDVSAITANVPLRSIAAGGNHSCAINVDNQLRCWGRDRYGATGRGETGYRLAPVKIQSDLKFSEISAGEYHSCGIVSDGRVACWGRDSYMSIGVPGDDEQPVPVILSDFDSAVLIESVDTRNCVVNRDGTTLCWGRDSYGTLGNGYDIGDADTPAPVLGGETFTAISMGSYSTCAVTSNSRPACWGREGYLGADIGQHSSPQILDMHPDYRDIAVSGTHGCGLDEAGTVHCWGYGSQGQLGQGDQNHSRYAPLSVPSTEIFVKVEASNSGTCALTVDGALYCWGNSPVDGVSGGDSLTPTPVRPDLQFEWVDGSESHVCAISNGDVYCWGEGDDGQLGHGLRREEDEPVQVDGLPEGAIRVSVGLNHTCAIVGDGDVYCWGFGEFGTLGHGELGFLDTPTAVDESALP